MPNITIGRFRGGYCVYWHDSDGRRRRYQLKALDRKAAEPEAIDVYRRQTTPTTGATVADIWEAYRHDLGEKPTARTMGYTGKAVLPHFGAFRPDQISKELCKSYQAKRLAQGKSQGTVHTELGHLRSALKYAQDTRIIDRAPRIYRPNKPAPPDRYLTREEIARLLEAARAPHIRLAIHLLYATAARVGAILDLTWDRVDFERGQINLRLDDSVTRKGRAIVPMNRGIRAALQTAHDAALSDFVVEHASGPVKSIRKGFTAAVARAGLADVTIHTLRHTSAVHMVSAGIPIEKVAQYLGHSNVATTYRVYARFAPGHLADAAEILDFVSLKSAG